MSATPAPEQCPNDKRGWHLWSARYPTCVYCDGDMRHVCLCDTVGRCPVHNPHPEEAANRPRVERHDRTVHADGAVTYERVPTASERHRTT